MALLSPPVPMPLKQHDDEEEDTTIDVATETPLRLVPLRHLYSATSPCVTASGSSMSKKIKARKLAPLYDPSIRKPPIVHVYNRRAKRELHSFENPSFFDKLMISREDVKIEPGELEVEKGAISVKRRRIGSSELMKLGVDSTMLCSLNGPRLREAKKNQSGGGVLRLKKLSSAASACAKRWVRLCFDDVDPKTFIGLQCKVHWPLDDDWYSGRVNGYDSETNRHCVEYEDGDEEHLILSNEKMKFYVSREDMKCLNLAFGISSMDSDGLDFSEMVVLAASLDGQELEPGDIIWAKLTGHAMWPAIVANGPRTDSLKGSSKGSEGKSVPVQFFGTHDFARIKPKQIISFLEGLLSSFHLKCKKPCFAQSLEEAKTYLSEQKLPERMLRMQNDVRAYGMKGEDAGSTDSDEDCIRDERRSNSEHTSRSSIGKCTSRRYRDLPVGYRPVRVDWKDLDKCNVCHMDEEYENNLFLQCDKCRMMVHARCYGELEPVNGVLWLCNLCRSEAPESPPPCCLCPVIGGAMKPTTDGRWAHLACAIWIPETCLSDVKKMEPIDGLSRINKDRWKLLCSICGVSYGACIQCSNITCRVAYHPLCARAADLCVELEDEDRLHLLSVDDDEEDQCIRLLSFCKKHRQPSNDRSTADDRTGQYVRQCSQYTPPSNPSGCARSEPYNYFGRRGRKEPEALDAASSKRLFVENRPYLVSGYCRHESFGDTSSPSALLGSKFSLDLQRLKTIQIDAPKNILSMSVKYTYMKETLKKRLAFGKSRIHGFGIFAKHPHRAGDMVIEYTGELVRPSIADRREHFIYNSLVGAGTYMFRIDDERVIDATRVGSIAHLINHSCEPNCYSRVISVNGDEHIIIFAKRDINRWEELAYDYRFFSIDEQLACYCGFPGCRSVVNDIEAEEQMAKLYAPCSELKDWRGE